MSTQVTTRIDRPVGDDVRQYSKGEIFAVFAAVTVTMSVLGWGSRRGSPTTSRREIRSSTPC